MLCNFDYSPEEVEAGGGGGGVGVRRIMVVADRTAGGQNMNWISRTGFFYMWHVALFIVIIIVSLLGG